MLQRHRGNDRVGPSHAALLAQFNRPLLLRRPLCGLRCSLNCSPKANPQGRGGEGPEGGR